MIPPVPTGTPPGQTFRERVSSGKILPLIGIYDVFSAKIAARRFEGVFCSGFSLAASSYGLPDIGYITWRDMLEFSTKVRHVLPTAHILVDVDDGFGDHVVASTTVRNLEANGLSAVMLEDQKRPRKCGHFEGKELLPTEEYLLKLEHVLAARDSLFVVARTDSATIAEARERVLRYAEAGADAVMVEAVRDLSAISSLASETSCPLMINQLHGGKSPNWTLAEMHEAGVSLVIYSTPCLFAAQHGIERYLDRFLKLGALPSEGTSGLADCSEILSPKR